MKIEEMNEAALASDEVVLSSELLEDDEVIPLQEDEADSEDADTEDEEDDGEDGEVDGD